MPALLRSHRDADTPSSLAPCRRPEAAKKLPGRDKRMGGRALSGAPGHREVRGWKDHGCSLARTVRWPRWRRGAEQDDGDATCGTTDPAGTRPEMEGTGSPNPLALLPPQQTGFGAAPIAPFTLPFLRLQLEHPEFQGDAQP